MSIQFLKLEIGLTKDNLSGEKRKAGKKGRKTSDSEKAIPLQSLRKA